MRRAYRINPARLSSVADAQKDETALTGALAAMLTSKSLAARVQVSCGDGYVYVTHERGAPTLAIVAPSSRHLADGTRLEQSGAQWLRREGFERPSGGRSFTLRMPIPSSLSDLAARCVEVLHQAYGCAPGESVVHVLSHDDRSHPSNEEVVEAMRRLASSRSHDDRLRLYNELVNATFLVPVSPDADESDDGADAWVNLEDSSQIVFAVFTDLPQMRAWKLDADEYLPTHGAEFFEEFMESGAVGLRINPGGTVGAELYRHEVELIVKGIRRWRGKTSS